MCILFLLVGDDTQPTLICSNRDEYFNRRTARGKLSDDGSYSPLDEEGGGTWISVSGLNGGPESFKYAVVLNFHHWREKYPFSARPPRGGKQVRSVGLLTRGLLTKNFTESTEVLALKYAQDVFERRGEYRPFNLVVSDSSGTFYASSSTQQVAVERLHPGRLYALTNGYLHDAWDKTSIGKFFVDEVLVNELRVCTRMPAAPTDIESIALKATSAFSTTMKEVAHKLVAVMETNTPLADPTFGRRSMPAMYLASVFVRPTLIIRKPVYKCAYLVKQFVMEIFALYFYFLGLCLNYLLGGARRASGAWTRTWAQQTRYWIHRTIALSYFQPAVYIPLRNGQGWLLPDSDLFGTRTITVIAYAPSAVGKASAGARSTPSPSASEANGESPNAPAAPAASQNVRVDSAVARKSAYYIMERDLDTQRNQWSDAVYTNVL